MAYNKLPYNDNLPPGCTPADIERNAGGDVPLCEECEKELITDQEMRLGLCKDCENAWDDEDEGLDKTDEDKNIDERQ